MSTERHAPSLEEAVKDALQEMMLIGMGVGDGSFSYTHGAVESGRIQAELLAALAPREQPQEGEREAAVADVLYGIWQLDNKPHQLFSALARFVAHFGDEDARKDLTPLLEDAYRNAHRLRIAALHSKEAPSGEPPRGGAVCSHGHGVLVPHINDAMPCSDYLLTPAPALLDRERVAKALFNMRRDTLIEFCELRYMPRTWEGESEEKRQHWRNFVVRNALTGEVAAPEGSAPCPVEWAFEELVRHMWVHSSYPRCGYNQMTTEQRALFDSVVSATPLGTHPQEIRTTACWTGDHPDCTGFDICECSCHAAPLETPKGYTLDDLAHFQADSPLDTLERERKSVKPKHTCDGYDGWGDCPACDGKEVVDADR